MDLPTLVFGALVLVAVQMSYSGERHLKCFSSLHLCRDGLANGKRLQPGFGSGVPAKVSWVGTFFAHRKDPSPALPVLGNPALAHK